MTDGNNDATTIREGRAAWERLNIASKTALSDWLLVGKALLILRRDCMAEVGADKPRGIKYVKANGRALKQHGFTAISKSARQTAMLVTENWPAVSQWLQSRSATQRELTHPMVTWRSYLASKRPHRREAWRQRIGTTETAVRRAIAAVSEELKGVDVDIPRVVFACLRAVDIAIPEPLIRKVAPSVRRNGISLPRLAVLEREPA
jgi:hypothetical protein